MYKKTGTKMMFMTGFGYLVNYSVVGNEYLPPHFTMIIYIIMNIIHQQLL